jgi:hypothetical protein
VCNEGSSLLKTISKLFPVRYTVLEPFRRVGYGLTAQLFIAGLTQPGHHPQQPSMPDTLISSPLFTTQKIVTGETGKQILWAQTQPYFNV